MKTITPLSKASLSNDFVFSHIMRQPDICRMFLEELMNIRISEISVVDEQKDLSDSFGSHAIQTVDGVYAGF